ncbi:hypothetical protein WKR88_16360 [Trinickia caryophylli]|uniref:Uncharacterized protein n=1 Tax=Trinickia caryophylli TaxID=28094 RepID=A0A1X7GHP1_TRICW|nr:hypothetical protein [Trinickia caryophylli]PMS08752.1 hypothetical protein C0Z17_28510 [Trinickia caryophylli]TRX13910.1 hypothetical protein FNF07_21340 [Trinickia caryophylli]WQE15501.1 hypothetical protein U0034_23550 [Trinickia caryophylli]SMF69211.1 hypothetical protein SAMN06295900_115144 [Trinickia caryophylli]GLU33752.1 hypothetical protein Busp01_35940 [Trinickia caryophylli]
MAEELKFREQNESWPHEWLRHATLALAALCIVGCSNHDATLSAKPAQSAPPVAKAPEPSVTILVNDIERQYIRGDVDEDTFDRVIRRADPRLASGTDGHLPNDERRALYFAKKIPLANGQTLYSWLHSCPLALGENMFASRIPAGASGAYEGLGPKAFMDAVYYPIIQMKGLGKEDSIALSWIIYEDGHIVPRTGRAKVYMSNPNFETQSGTECR